MSPSWRNRVSIALYPERVVWLRVPRGLIPRVEHKGEIHVETDAAVPWRGPLQGLDQALAAADAAGTSLSILLSNRLVRYALTPNPDSAGNRDELDLIVRHVFERTHGDVASGWDIRLSDSAPGRPALASAIDREFLQAMRELARKHRCRLGAVRPYLMAAYNRLTPARRAESGAFMMLEPGRLCQLAWKEGGWCAVQQTHAGHDWPQQLQLWMERFAVQATIAPETLQQFCAPEFGNLALPEGSRRFDPLLPHWLHGLSPTHDQAYAGAMLGLA